MGDPPGPLCDPHSHLAAGRKQPLLSGAGTCAAGRRPGRCGGESSGRRPAEGPFVVPWQCGDVVQWPSSRPLCLGVWSAGSCSTSDAILVLGDFGQVTAPAALVSSCVEWGQGWCLARGLLCRETAGGDSEHAASSGWRPRGHGLALELDRGSGWGAWSYLPQPLLLGWESGGARSNSVTGWSRGLAGV